MYDSYPNYKPAGITTPYTGESAGNCIQPSRQNLSTPEQIARFRKSYKNQAGKTITHYGKLYDPLPTQNFTYGQKTPSSDHIPHVLRDEALEGLQGYVRNLKEAQYARNKKEPLGQTVNRSYQWPKTIENKGFSFGVATLASESAKDVLYSHPSVYEDDLTRELYVKSHSLFEAGEQKKRPYKWPFDPKHHIFGRSGKMVINEAKMCLQPEVAEENYPKTVILKKNVEDFKDFSSYPVGSPKNLGQQRVQSLGPNHVYGFKPKNQEPWSAGKCIHGEPTFYEVQPDADLGKSTRFGFRNTPHAGDESRTFGIPTIRNDIQKPLHKSVSDQFNYGDEPEAFKLLNPESFHEMGVSRQDFEALRPKEEIRKLFANIGYAYKPGKFEGIFMRAQDLCRTHDDYVSINAFKQAIQELDHLE